MHCSNLGFVHFVNLPTPCSHLGGQDGEVLGFSWGMVPSFSDGGMLVLVWLGSVRVGSKSEAAFDELDTITL